MTFGAEADETTSRAIIDRYLDAGGNFIDTADVYSSGVSEEIVGRALAGRRDNVVLATKGRMPMGEDINSQGANRRHLTKAVEASLRRLNTDWIDLYQIHWPDESVRQEETLSTLDGLVREGKIRYVGVSNYLAHQLQRAVDLSERYGWAPVVSHQPQYSLVVREIELDSMPLCRENQIAVLPWSPLGGGVLTGKYRRGEELPANVRITSSENQRIWFLTERNFAIADEVSRIATETGHSAAQVALNWVLHRPGVTAPIIGARTIEQLQDNLDCEGWQLDAEQVAALNEVSAMVLPYPHREYQMIGIRKYD